MNLREAADSFLAFADALDRAGLLYPRDFDLPRSGYRSPGTAFPWSDEA